LTPDLQGRRPLEDLAMATRVLLAKLTPERVRTVKSNPDLQQPLAERPVGREVNMPVLHLPQLVGLALGLDPKELGMQRHVVKPVSVIDWTSSVVAGVRAEV
jgi:heterodisulfide reductase subunit B